MSSKSYKDLSPSRRFENARLQDLLPIKNAILDLFSKLAKNPFDVPNVLNQLSTSEHFQNFTDEISKRFFKSCFLKHDELYKKNFFSKAHRIFNSLSSDNHLIDFIGNKIKEKSELFKTIPADLASDIIPYINAWSLQGKTSAIIFPDLKNQISQLLDWQIRRIARTEVSKSLTDITEFKCSQGNIKIYQWKASGGGRGDGRTRFSHRKMADILIFWDDPPAPEDLFPIIGKNGKKYKNTLGHYHAGCCPNCRCVAMPVVSISDIEFPARIYYGGSIHRINKFDFLKLYGNIETKKQEPEKAEKTLTPEDLEELFNEDPFDNESLQELYEEELEKQKKAEEEAKQKAEEERLLELIDPDEFEHLGEFFSEESLEGLFEKELEKQKAEEETKKKAEEEAKKKAEEEAKKKAEEEAKKKAEEEAKKKAKKKNKTENKEKTEEKIKKEEEKAKKKAEKEAKKKAKEEEKRQEAIWRAEEEEKLKSKGIRPQDLQRVLEERLRIKNNLKRLTGDYEQFKELIKTGHKKKANNLLESSVSVLSFDYKDLNDNEIEDLKNQQGELWSVGGNITREDSRKLNNTYYWGDGKFIVDGKKVSWGYYRLINTAFRKGDFSILDEKAKEAVDIFDKTFKKNHTNKSITLTRYVDDSSKLYWFKDTFGFTYDINNFDELLETKRKLEEDFLLKDITEKSYMSTSYLKGGAEYFARKSYIKLVVFVPAGTNLYITDNSQEGEIIFPPGTKLKLLAVNIMKPNDITPHIHLELTVQVMQ